MRTIKWFSAAATLLLFGSVFIGCSLFGPTGNLSVELTDWPLLDKEVTAVNITVTAVEVRQTAVADDEAGWITIAEPNEEYNLLELQHGVAAALGDSDIPAGTYTELRLHLSSDNTIEVQDDTERYPLKVPSGTSSGIKIKYTFTIVESGSTTITLDFDAQQSVKVDETGTEYQLHPVIRVKEVP